ncbi:MAG: AbrB/MazE/SpoVT family DNA-binding domain-containing protein [Gammaproteobacteria bacterium]|nr:AbrB/MazE/SpoVT family DNA-binding domain-containing protein [Gammaproteobacteria bacterium]
MSIATTKMSSKGQVVIPENIRGQLGLEAGTQFVVLGQGDSVILKVIQPPPQKDIDKLLAATTRAARKAGAKKSDITKAIKKARAGK